MKKLFFFFFIFLLLSCKNSLNIAEEKIDSLHSANTNDAYTIEERLPAGFDKKKEYNIVLVADGSIGLGEYVLGKYESWKADLPTNCIIITIGHQGEWEMKRKRDFIPSDITANSEDDFGNAHKFYSFLKSELIPFIDKKFPRQKSKVFIGHSFSGLFSLYAALKNDKLFDQYFSISPSVWANYGELLKIEETYAETNTDLKSTIHIYVGGLEIFNKVLSSSTEFYNKINSRAYKNLKITMETIGGANHFSVRKPAIDKILKSLNE